MNIQQARQHIAETFSHAFSKARFLAFIRNLLNQFDESKARAWGATYVKDAFKNHVARFERLGTYTSPEDEKLDVLIVHLTGGAKLERARTALRNFVADHLKQRNEKDAALVAFISPTKQQWRFSYVRMEYAAVEKDGKVGVATRLTPARRLSYIVGEGESCHTAQSRFLPLLQDTENYPTLAQIEDAFSVEAVTKEFFNQYAAQFGAIEAALRKLAAQDPVVGKELKTKNVSPVDFAKKLMGQLVFLSFLQKKGWLGVAKGQNWGTGPHDFLRRLCRGEHGGYQNFFNDVLEPLFYDTLATDRGHEAWCHHFQCRIPFLNGGLFEPLGDYDWRQTPILLPNKLFANTERNPAGDVGTGVLDVFDRYNFTVSEAEPLEKEVAIDPEMLGKVFENLIEENRRKGLGSYYTPREIVHYMCQESLINYLDTAVNGGTDIPVCASEGEIHKTRRNLPHWTRNGSIYWITFRLADSLPQEKLSAWAAEREIWLKHHPEPWGDEDWKEYDERFGERLQFWLDAGYGSCALARPEIRRMVQDCLLRFDGERLRLHAGVIMPNHVHLLLEPLAANSLSELLKGIKGASARKANQILGNTGTTFWMDESYDHIVRSERQYQYFLRYIADNPVKAKLSADKFWLYQGDTTQTGMSVPRCDLETFVHLGDQIAHYAAVEARYAVKMPKSIKQHARLIDEKLAAITVCDPAVGSGAFPVGMMTEIVRARSALTPYFNDVHDRTAYHFKRHAIQNCLFGVDIDPGAVEIAKLRLWLSLVVDEEDVKQIKPLPNLDYKIVTGNSLLGVEKTLFNDELFKQLEISKPSYFNATDHSQKEALKRKIDELIHTLTSGSEVFDFHIYFSEVFHNRNGFDVIIANPPYDVLNVTEGHQIERQLLEKIRSMPRYASALGGKLNLFRLFTAQGLQLLAGNACLTFIIPYGFMCDSSSKKLRETILKEKQLVFVEAFPERDDPRKRLFESAKMSTCIILLKNRPTRNPFPVRTHYARQVKFDVPTVHLDLKLIAQIDPFNWSLPLMDNAELAIVRKMISGNTKRLKDFGRCYEGEVNLTFHKKYLRNKRDGNERLIKGAAVQRYLIKDKMSQGEIQFLDEDAFRAACTGPKTEHHAAKRIIMQGMTGVNERVRLKMTLLDSKAYCGNSVNYILLNSVAVTSEALLAMLNSTLLNWYFKLFSTNSNVNGYEIDSLPIARVAESDQQRLAASAMKILAAKVRDAAADTSALEREIDQLVYALYGLTPEEIQIVEGAAK